MSVLMAITVVTIVVMGFLLYHRFKLAIDRMAVANTESNVESMVDRVNADLLDMRQIFNAANYNIVQEFDISSREFTEQFSLLYETNSDKVQSVALYGSDGKLISSEPVSVEKKIDVTRQDWYRNAEDAIENIHFSVPHIQNLFADGSYRFHRVVSLSRYVDVNDGDKPRSGVLLVDMKYSVIEDVLKQINDSSEGIYYYLISRDGEIIYHPRRAEMDRGLFNEKSVGTAKYEDGTYSINADGHRESIVVGSIAYTGWKLVGVVPESVQTASINRFRYYVFTTITILLMMLLYGNRLVSRKISKPIRQLEESVKDHEAGGKPDIYIGGSTEIRHLGYSVQKSYEQIETLMEEIIRQQNERRKSELDALQSQINPHFLYNILGSIQTCQSLGKLDIANQMLTNLTRFYRMTLRKSEDLISIRDELTIAQLYLEMEKLCHNDNLTWEINMEDGIDNFLICKFTLQPFLENSIMHGLSQKTPEVHISIDLSYGDDTVIIVITDNGIGMAKEQLLELQKTLDEKIVNYEKHFGIGNVNKRISNPYFGNGRISVESCLYEGTSITIEFDQMEKYDEECNDCR